MWFQVQVFLLGFQLLDRVNSQITLPGQTCTCVPRNQCYQNISTVTDGSGVIDIRIVTQIDTGIPTAAPTAVPTGAPGACAAGTETCCYGPAAVGCGIRYNIPVTPITTPVNGQLKYGSQPWQAVVYDLANTFIGGGALLDPSNVITAAHKVAGRANGTIKVRMGDWNVASATEPFPLQEVLVAQIRIHPLYNQTIPLANNNLQNNVAILRLATPITMNNPAINTICLPSATSVFDGQRCLVAGWGKDAFNGTLQNIAKEVEVPVVPYADCQAKLRATTRLGPFFNLDSNSFLCAGGEPGRDACTGDGGSALACIVGGRYQLAGLVAWGIGCADNNVPGVYVKVSSFLNWTQAQLNS